jgi:hypothetical protein
MVLGFPRIFSGVIATVNRQLQCFVGHFLMVGYVPMSVPDPIQQNVFDTSEGIRDFKDFPEYFEGWIKSNLLPDLETVWEGARTHWLRREMNDGAPGRGDFVLATALFTALDHLGSFLAPPDVTLSGHENVARVAKELPSTQDVYAIFGNMRNVIVHNAWPQTHVPGRENRWAFGLTFSTNSRFERHDVMYVGDRFQGVGRNGPSVPVVKLKLNLHVLNQQLVDWVMNPAFVPLVSPKAFERIRELSRYAGDRHGRARDKADEQYYGTAPDEWTTWTEMSGQIQALYRESLRIGCWGDDDKAREVVRDRDYAGKESPSQKNEHRKMLVVKSIERLRAAAAAAAQPNSDIRKPA